MQLVNVRPIWSKSLKSLLPSRSKEINYSKKHCNRAHPTVFALAGECGRCYNMANLSGSLSDDQYFLIFTVACFFWFLFSFGFATLNVCLYWSYHWQAGTKTRYLSQFRTSDPCQMVPAIPGIGLPAPSCSGDRIPIYVAAVEMSVENMRLVERTTMR